MTAGELRVRARTQGLGGRDAAAMLSISEPTIHIHLRCFYSKANIVRRSDLRRLLQNAMPPIRQGRRPDLHS